MTQQKHGNPGGKHLTAGGMAGKTIATTAAPAPSTSPTVQQAMHDAAACAQKCGSDHGNPKCGN